MLEAIGVSGPRVWGKKGGGKDACQHALDQLAPELARDALSVLMRCNTDSSGCNGSSGG